MWTSLDKNCEEATKTIDSIVARSLEIGDEHHDQFLHVMRQLNPNYDTLRDLCNESPSGNFETSIGAALGTSFLTGVFSIANANERLELQELGAFSNIESWFSPYLFPEGTKLARDRSSPFMDSLEPILDLGLGFVVAGGICSLIDVFQSSSTLHDLRNEMFKLCTSFARLGGLEKEELLLRNKIDRSFLELAERIDRAFQGQPDIETDFNPMIEAPKAVKSDRPTNDKRSAEWEGGDFGEAKRELDQLIGLAGVKLQVSQLIAFLHVQERRRKRAFATANQTLHFVFSGNPGTGKTTVARILGRLLFGMGILSRPDVVECGRSDLVAGYVGQTAIKTAEIIDSARGGILFIDEAYTLADEGQSNDYGQEAIDTLLKKMEDYREELVVVAAGYPDLMNQFIQSNPGLESRFTKYIRFENFLPRELCQVFELFCSKNDYVLTNAAKCKLSFLVHELYRAGKSQSGNGRLMRNLFDDAMNAHAMRVAYDQNIDDDDLTEFADNDISFSRFPEMALQYEVNHIRWRVSCPNCENIARASAKHIGMKVVCRKCKFSFTCPWYDLA